MKVPDPDVVIALEASQEEVTQLRAELTELSAVGVVAVSAQDAEVKLCVLSSKIQNKWKQNVWKKPETES